MNGTYTREVGVLHENAPVYTKRGLWEGNDVNYAIYRRSTYWYFGQWNEDGGPCEKFTMYRSLLNGSSLTLPKDGWKNIKWQCVFCEEAQFEDYDEACEHEKI